MDQEPSRIAQDAAMALATAERFWTALAADDDEDLARVLSAAALARQPRRAGYPGLAAAFRDGWRLTPDQIQSASLIDTLGMVAGSGFRVRRTLRPPGPVEAGESIEAWPVDVLPDGEGGWVVDPIRPFPREELGSVQFRIERLDE